MRSGEEYEVRLDLFEGPLDLLLFLVTKSEVEITAISVAQVTRQYLDYLDLIRELNIDVASEYLHMAATLLRLKARELLPRDTHENLEDAEDDIYTREQLIEQLLEYKKYKEAAGTLKVFESQQQGTFARGIKDEMPEVEEPEDPGIGNVTIFDLLTAFKSILERAATEEPRHVVVSDDVRIDDRLEHILGLLSEKKEIPFAELFSDDVRRIALVATFMAILELIKMQQIWFRQEEQFGSIFVSYREEEERERGVDLEAEEGGEGE